MYYPPQFPYNSFPPYNPYQMNPYPDFYNPYMGNPYMQQPSQPSQTQSPQRTQLKDEEIMIENKKIGMSSKIGLNVRTSLIIITFLWSVLTGAWIYTWQAEKKARAELESKLFEKVDEIKKDVNTINNRTYRIEGQLSPIIDKTSTNKQESGGGEVSSKQNRTKPDENNSDSTPPAPFSPNQ